MKIKNTSRFNIALVKEVIRFVRPAGISNFDIMVKNSRYAYAGRSYRSSGYHHNYMPFIVVRIGKEHFFPTMSTHKHGKGYLTYLIRDSIEALVVLLAHELRHQWQAIHKRSRIWNSRGKYSERDADAYALRKLREWRRQKQVIQLVEIQLGVVKEEALEHKSVE